MNRLIWTRRVFTLAGLSLPLAASAATAAGGPRSVALWPGTPPGGTGMVLKEAFTDNRDHPDQPNRSITGVSLPELELRHPATPNGEAILVLPGGGFRTLAYDKEGTEVAEWLSGLGFVTGVLKYRLPAEGWKAGMDVAVQDCQRALRLLRQEVKGGRTGVMGFSAGGYLAAALAVRFNERLDGKVDAADAYPARPDFAAIIYGAFGAKGSFMPPLADKVSRDTPPVFLAHSADDPKAPATGCLAAAGRLMSLKVPVELHLFADGGHGYALRRPPGSEWARLFERWVTQGAGSGSG